MERGCGGWPEGGTVGGQAGGGRRWAEVAVARRCASKEG